MEQINFLVEVKNKLQLDLGENTYIVTRRDCVLSSFDLSVIKKQIKNHIKKREIFYLVVDYSENVSDKILDILTMVRRLDGKGCNLLNMVEIRNFDKILQEKTIMGIKRIVW